MPFKFPWVIIFVTNLSVPCCYIKIIEDKFMFFVCPVPCGYTYYLFIKKLFICYHYHWVDRVCCDFGDGIFSTIMATRLQHLLPEMYYEGSIKISFRIWC